MTLVFSLTRERPRQPVGLSSDVLEDLSESEALEPPRGPRVQVSPIVPARGHDGNRAMQPGYRCSIHLLQGKVDRPRQVLLRILSLREHIQDLSALRHQARDFLPVDVLERGPLLREGCFP